MDVRLRHVPFVSTCLSGMFVAFWVKRGEYWDGIGFASLLIS